MFGRATILLAIAACAVTMPVFAQAPAPTIAFDGKYVGTATIGRGRAITTCWAINSMNMTITGGQVVIHAIRYTGNEPTLRGSVNTAGEVSASLQIGSNFLSMSGTIHDKVFTGQRVVAQCYWSVQMQIAPPPTPTAFDGTYTGVSKTIEGVVGGYDRKCATNSRPGPLTIVNGAATWAGDVEGSVSPEGILVMYNPSGARFVGQIDGQGTLTGRFTAGCSYQLVWQKKGP